MPPDDEAGIVMPKMDDYLQNLLRPRDTVLRNIENEAYEHHVPIVGPLCGNLLSILSRSIGAKNALEIGTATGYSGIWIARALAENSGKLITIEFDSERAKAAQKNFKRAGIADNVEIVQGNAAKIVPKLAEEREGGFDLIFLDVGEKSIYIDLLGPCITLLREGGLLIADNVLWSGYVATSGHKDDETETMRKFNKLAYAENRLDPVIIPLRDGMLVARKSLRKKASF